MSVVLDQDTYRAVLDGIATGAYVVDLNRTILLWNRAAEQIAGFYRQEVVGRCCADNLLMHCDENGIGLCYVACPLSETMHDGKPREADVFLRHKDGERVPVRVWATPLHDAHGAIVGAIETFEEKTHLLEPEAGPRVRMVQAVADDVTGVAGRESLLAYLEAALGDRADDGLSFGVVSVRIANLESLSHARGARATDAMARVLAATLQKNLRPADRLGRWSRDCFLALLTHCPEEALPRVTATLQRHLSLASIHWWGDWVPIEVIVSAATARDGDTALSLAARSVGEPERTKAIRLE
jgi:PAS domain S-box-containing protein